jgi:putative NADH-flavin reductase
VRLLVFGATGGTGRAVLKKALAAGHEVTAFVRDTRQLCAQESLSVIEGDALHAPDVRKALADQDAIVLTLGNPQSSVARLLGAKRTVAPNICEVATRNILAALPAAGQIPILVVSAFGVGETSSQLPLSFRLFYALLLREQMADKEKQETLLRGSSANFVLIQPVALTDKPETGAYKATTDGSIGAYEVSRTDLAQFIVQELEQLQHSRKTVSFSG